MTNLHKPSKQNADKPKANFGEDRPQLKSTAAVSVAIRPKAL